MPACSTACSVPGTCSGDSRAAAITSGPTVYQNARVTRRVGGRSSGS